VPVEAPEATAEGLLGALARPRAAGTRRLS
jgi:hypothetical protein